MSALELIRECRRRGLRLLVDGKDLRYVGPRSAIDPVILRELQDAKGDLVTLSAAFRGQRTSSVIVPDADLEDLLERFEERAAILEYDAGFERAEAERLAREMTLNALAREADLHA